MSDHSAIVDQYLKTEFPSASIMDDHDRERHGHLWSIKHNDTIMVLRVSQEFLTAQSEYEARTLLNNFNVAKTLRESAGPAVLLTRDGVAPIPEMPA